MIEELNFWAINKSSELSKLIVLYFWKDFCSALTLLFLWKLLVSNFSKRSFLFGLLKGFIVDNGLYEEITNELFILLVLISLSLFSKDCIKYLL